MKKIYLLLVAGILSTTVLAQKSTLAHSKLTDNWFIGLNGGISAKTTGVSVMYNLNPQASLTAGRYFTPYYGLSINGQFGFNNQPRPETDLFVKGHSLILQHMFNLNNLFTKYKGEPNLFEVVALVGVGWKSEYVRSADGDNLDYLSTKYGLQFNFNLGQKKAWQINVEPSIIYNLTATDPQVSGKQSYYFDVTRSYLNLMAGVTYKFKNSNGTHNFALATLRDQAEIDALNERNNALRSQINAKDGQLNNAKKTIDDLNKKLDDCLNKKPLVNEKGIEAVVSFHQGKTNIDKLQMPNVERVAMYLKNNPDSKIVINGYASPEGSISLNQKLAENRAQEVKNVLVKKYKIDASRISAAGKGIGTIFEDKAMNRVSICTMD